MELQQILDDHKSWLLGRKGRCADFSHMSLIDSNFNNIDLSYVLAVSTRLCRSNFSNSSLKSANFEGADLRDANFEGTNLENANFSDADLRGANFLGANLTGADFWRANVQGITILPEQLHSAFLCKLKNN